VHERRGPGLRWRSGGLTSATLGVKLDGDRDLDPGERERVLEPGATLAVEAALCLHRAAAGAVVGAPNV
jgi:hypothetical protein